MCPETSAWKLCRVRKPLLLVSGIWPGTLTVVNPSGRNLTCPFAGRRGSVLRPEGLSAGKEHWAGRVGERATLACDPLSPRRTGQADFPASGSPENVSPQACAGSCTAASLIDAPAQIAGVAHRSSLLPAVGRA